MKRRKLIVDYLEDLSHSSHEIKFGDGGVKRTLQAYFDKQEKRIVVSISSLKI
ncbi:hypothetical protein [Alteribacillus sp. YIM 98480]|uniref:hypothetical protein n=1 Tax=Alteribacillus sp. YIM 98480 TaxID=2606599 RepID=UPI00131BF120|nr:hypothetical protein [Alteribacillus sp. YIM 98480]